MQSDELLTWTCFQDGDGVAAAVENAVPSRAGSALPMGDGNGDNVLDMLQSNVASMPTKAAGAPYITLTVADGQKLTDVAASEFLPAGLPVARLRLGLLHYDVQGMTGDGAKVTVLCHNLSDYLFNRLVSYYRDGQAG